MEDFIYEHYEDASGEVAEQLAEDAAQKTWIWLKMEGYLGQNHSADVEREEFREEMGFNVSDEEVEEVQEVEESDPPGEDWDCECGAWNEGDRSVCRSCGGHYEEKRAD